jgi:spore germination cell wall hydrolase CwlJ-like protein
VAETVINRANSGRFPASICGVVRQPGQFSFVRGGQVPSAPKASKAWAVAVAIARIAQDEMYRDVAPNALYFHASRVRPGWSGAKRIAQLGNHVFYR